MSMHSCAVYVTIFSTSGKFQLVSNFAELHGLTQAAHSYALLPLYLHIHYMCVTLTNWAAELRAAGIHGNLPQISIP